VSRTRWLERAAAALVVVMLLAALAQALVGLAGGFPLLILTALFTAALALPVLMQTARAPCVVVREDGLLIQSAVWPERLVPYRDIIAIRDDPSLPPPGAEVLRKGAVGRAKYRPAQGRILLIHGLPLPYRITGWFAGAGLTGVIAIGSRTHPDYETLIAQIAQRMKST
jgi:hypothetical protein